MSEFVEAVVEYPTVVFTVLLSVSLLMWLVSMAAGDGGLDLDGGTDDLLGDDGGVLDGVMDALDLTGLPFTILLTLVSLFGWVTSLAIMAFVNPETAFAVTVIGSGVLLVSFVASVALSTVIGRPLARALRTHDLGSKAALVGRVCRVRSAKVTAAGGQAEVDDGEGGVALVAVRCEEDNDLAYGSEAILYSYDADSDTFLVAPSDLNDLTQ